MDRNTFPVRPGGALTDAAERPPLPSAARRGAALAQALEGTETRISVE